MSIRKFCSSYILREFPGEIKEPPSESKKRWMDITFKVSIAIIAIGFVFMTIALLIHGPNIHSVITRAFYCFMGGALLLLITSCVLRCLYFRELDKEKSEKSIVVEEVKV